MDAATDAKTPATAAPKAKRTPKPKATKKPAKAKVKAATRAKPKLKPSPKKKPALAAKGGAKTAKVPKARKPKVAAKPRRAKESSATKAARGLHRLMRPLAVKKVIKSADAVALDTLVKGLKHNHLDAENVFKAELERLPSSVQARAIAIVGRMGLNPRAAGVLAVRVAELEQEGGTLIENVDPVPGYETADDEPDAARA